MTNSNSSSNTLTEEELRSIGKFALLSACTCTDCGLNEGEDAADEEDKEGGGGGGGGGGRQVGCTRSSRRRSQASMEFFQRATSRPSSALSVVSSDGEPQEEQEQRRRSKRNSFIGLDGKIQDRYIAQRAALNKPETTTVLGLSHNNGTRPPQPLPLPVDLLTHAATMTTLDGTRLAHLFLCGYARLSSKVAELNRINVFPIADGDTGANMKVCLKVPARNLLLEPTTSIVRVAANMAADVLLNGTCLMASGVYGLAWRFHSFFLSKHRSFLLSIVSFCLLLSDCVYYLYYYEWHCILH